MRFSNVCIRAGPSELLCLSPLIVVAGIWVAYLLGLVVYRLFLSPLAKFPGSKLAASTGWYETYYQLVKGGGGRFTFKIQEWHEKYGPIIRINPNELHICDSEFYETIYSGSHTIDRPSYAEYEFAVPGATISTITHELHRERRAALSPFYSKRKILEQGSYIQSLADQISRRLVSEYSSTEKCLHLNDLFSCYVADVATKTAFDRSYRFLDRPDFLSPFTIAITNMKKFGHVCLLFPWIPKALMKLPTPLIMALSTSMTTTQELKDELRNQIYEIRQGIADGKDDRLPGTIFKELFHSDLSPSQLSDDRLVDEAVSVIGAGIETTKWTLVVTFFHVLNDPSVLQRLREELEHAIPDQSSPPPLSELEQLPWLMACINEGLRLAYGKLTRSPRIFRNKPLQYRSWTIPPGVPVSSDTWHLHHDEHVFPDSFSYKPERWYNSVKGSDDQKKLSRYLGAFGKGSRACLGIQLAYAEMVIVTATLFGRFDFELFETGRIDVDCHHDEVGVGVDPRSKGVRVLVK